MGQYSLRRRRGKSAFSVTTLTDGEIYSYYSIHNSNSVQFSGAVLAAEVLFLLHPTKKIMDGIRAIGYVVGRRFPGWLVPIYTWSRLPGSQGIIIISPSHTLLSKHRIVAFVASSILSTTEGWFFFRPLSRKDTIDHRDELAIEAYPSIDNQDGIHYVYLPSASTSSQKRIANNILPLSKSRMVTRRKVGQVFNRCGGNRIFVDDIWFGLLLLLRSQVRSSGLRLPLLLLHLAKGPSSTSSTSSSSSFLGSNFRLLRFLFFFFLFHLSFPVSVVSGKECKMCLSSSESSISSHPQHMSRRRNN